MLLPKEGTDGGFERGGEGEGATEGAGGVKSECDTALPSPDEGVDGDLEGTWEGEGVTNETEGVEGEAPAASSTVTALMAASAAAAAALLTVRSRCRLSAPAHCGSPDS